MVLFDVVRQRVTIAVTLSCVKSVSFLRGARPDSLDSVASSERNR